MLIDAAVLPSGSTLDASVCVVGAGPAGLTIARELAARGVDCIVLERGGEPGEPLGVGASETVVTGDSDFEPPPGIPPRFGGGSNEWIVRLPWMRRGVRMLPLAPIDFETRDWVPASGWPITWSQLEPYLRRAHDALGLGRWGYRPDDWEDSEHPRLPLEAAGFRTAMERFPVATAAGADLWNELRSSTLVRIVLNAPAGALDGAPEEVERVEVDAGGRSRVNVTARRFVLAGGGVENPRLVMSARGGEGIGAGGEAVGRYYMDHLRFVSGILTPTDPRLFARAGLYDIRRTSDGIAMGKIVPTDELLRTHRILHSGAQLLPRPPDEITDALRNVATVIRDLRARRRPRLDVSATLRAVTYVATTAPEMSARQRRFPPRTDAGWSSLSRNQRRYASFTVEHQIEQAPIRTNGFRLTGRRDRFGRPATELRWTWDELDLVSARTTQRLFGEAMAAAGVGAFAPVEWSEQPELTTPGGSFHPTGGTRMHASPASGVVDADCRVHGVKNLYVAGSSVFPTCGYANPTLTILALATRLADHLADHLVDHAAIR